MDQYHQHRQKRTMPKQSLTNARALRKSMTDAERRLWYHLRAGRLGVHFRRQAPIGPYIVDFAAIAHRLVVEIDGGQHAEPDQAGYDARRTADLERLGFRVLRFWNNEVLGHTEVVAEQIWEALGQPPLSPRPPPPGGEGGKLDRSPASPGPPPPPSNPSPPPPGEGPGERGERVNTPPAEQP